MRSAMAPDTMVAAVAQNTRLNTKLDQSKFSYAVKMSKPRFHQISRQSSLRPTAGEKPIRINTMVPMQKSIRFFIRILPAFFARVKPGFHHGKSGLHEEYQCRADQEPYAETADYAVQDAFQDIIPSLHPPYISVHLRFAGKMKSAHAPRGYRVCLHAYCANGMRLRAYTLNSRSP